MTTSPFLRTLSLLTLTALLAQQTQALAQEPPQQPATPAPQAETQQETAQPPLPNPLRQGTEVQLVVTESVSSATAVKGQLVHMAVAKDVLLNGNPTIAIPRGTPALGVVKRVQKAVPGKSDGRLEITPTEILPPPGVQYRLQQYAPGEDDCGDMGPCWALVTITVLLSPLLLGYFILGSPWIIGYSIRDHQQEVAYRKSHPASAEPLPGNEALEKPCSLVIAYTSDKLSLTAPPADSPSTTANRDTLDALCPAQRLKVQPVAVTPQPLPVLVPTELSADPHPALTVQP